MIKKAILISLLCFITPSIRSNTVPARSLIWLHFMDFKERIALYMRCLRGKCSQSERNQAAQTIGKDSFVVLSVSTLAIGGSALAVKLGWKLAKRIKNRNTGKKVVTPPGTMGRKWKNRQSLKVEEIVETKKNGTVKKGFKISKILTRLPSDVTQKNLDDLSEKNLVTTFPDIAASASGSNYVIVEIIYLGNVYKGIKDNNKWKWETISLLNRGS